MGAPSGAKRGAHGGTPLQFQVDLRLNTKVSPMIEQKNIPELIETSLICVLSAVAGLLGFFLVWLVCMLLGFGRT